MSNETVESLRAEVDGARKQRFGGAILSTDAKTEARFWALADRAATGTCWMWRGTKRRAGYGLFWIKNKRLLAHRVSWAIANPGQPLPALLRHKCDNPSCVNPAHLEAGTHADNAADMVARGRSVWGERHSSAKLTAEQVTAMRARHAAGESTSSIAKSVGMSLSATQHAVAGRRWAHLHGPSGLTAELAADLRRRRAASESVEAIARRRSSASRTKGGQL